MSKSSRKVVVGMSGGVDSSVAAALLARQGYEVIGVSINLVTCDRTAPRSCCAPTDRQDAREVCATIGIKHVVVDRRAEFKEGVIRPFVDEYLRGRTPSPCVLCNERVKFGGLIEEAGGLGAHYIATGHYARVASVAGSYRLLKASDASKDQSYFLFRMNQSELERTLFPLGSMKKQEVRSIAADLGLAVHKKPDSQEICFVPEGDCADFIEERAGPALPGPGNFVDLAGKILGKHRGIHAFTIGQRRGLGIGMGSRRYVVRIDPVRNEVVLGGKDDLLSTEAVVRAVSWVGGQYPEHEDVIVKIRSTHLGESARIDTVDGSSVLVRFAKPVRAVAPGQAAVFYRDDEVIGGGWLA